MNERARQRNAAFLLGITTVIAGFFTWRAGQIGSDAAYADRTSIGQTIAQEQRNMEVGLAAISDAQTYIRYRGDYAEAAAVDAQAELLDQYDLDELATASRDEADDVRLAASARASRDGLFGREEIYENLAADSHDPLPFDFDEQVVLLQAEASSGVTTPSLDPQQWADEANGIRDRIRELRITVLVLLLAVAAFTVVQVSDRRWVQYTGVIAGLVILVSASTTAVVTSW